MKYLVTLAAVAAMCAQPLYAINPANEGLPEFGDISMEAIGDIAVPAIDVPARQELGQTIDERRDAEPIEYAFDLPVKNPNADLYPIEVADESNGIFIKAARKAYGSYEVEVWIEGDTAAFKVFKLDSNRYLVRGDEVNLTATGHFSVFGSYYDVSGNIPTPIAETLSFRLNFRDSKSRLVADEPGYRLDLRQNYVTGKVDTSMFSKADAACIIALGMAIHRDLPDHDPAWVPYNPPEPWVYRPHHPDLIIHNPWYHHHLPRPNHDPRPRHYPNPWNHNDHNGPVHPPKPPMPQPHHDGHNGPDLGRIIERVIPKPPMPQPHHDGHNSPDLGRIIERVIPKPQPAPQPKPRDNDSGLGRIIERVIPKPQPPQPKPRDNDSGLGRIIERVIPKPQPAPQPKPQNSGSGLGRIIERVIPKPQPAPQPKPQQPQPKPQNSGSGLGNLFNRLIPKR